MLESSFWDPQLSAGSAAARRDRSLDLASWTYLFFYLALGCLVLFADHDVIVCETPSKGQLNCMRVAWGYTHDLRSIDGEIMVSHSRNLMYKVAVDTSGT